MGRIIFGVLSLALLSAYLYPVHADKPVEINLISPEPIRMNRNEIKDISFTLNITLRDPAYFRRFLDLTLKTETVSPQIKTLEIIKNTHKFESIPLEKLSNRGNSYSFMITTQVHSMYIGHARIVPQSARLYNHYAYKRKLTIAGEEDQNDDVLLSADDTSSLGSKLDVTIVEHEGIWGTIFLISVTLFIVISYINLGAQLDEENIKQMTKKPKAIILGFLITVLVMPLISWFVSSWLLSDQLLYRAGSFIFACCPAASASTLWTVMLDADKELSVGLQVVSMAGALVTMPILLYFMDVGLQADQMYRIRVPYARLSQTLLVLLLALFVGWRFVGRNKRASQISSRIFRPLTFFVLIFIIVFSSIIYWYIYRMFDWTITLASFIITISTYLITGCLGYLINSSRDQAVAVSIGSAYKNSGIAFAILVVTFDTPDNYIAYVPGLTQVVTTSLTLYLFYSLMRLINFLKRRGQPEPIQATVEGGEPDQEGAVRKESRSGSQGGKSTKSGENADEFIAMNVTDIVPGSPSSQKDLEAGHHIQAPENVEQQEGKV